MGPALARVNRLVESVIPALPDFNAMTDGELEHHYLELLEKAVGSAAAFPTADAFASAALNAINDMNEEFG